MTWIKIHFFLVVFINCRTPKLLQRQVVCYLLIRFTKNLFVLKYFLPYLGFDEKRNSAFFGNKPWISEIHILKRSGPPPFKIFLDLRLVFTTTEAQFGNTNYPFFSVRNIALNNYGAN